MQRLNNLLLAFSRGQFQTFAAVPKRSVAFPLLRLRDVVGTLFTILAGSLHAFSLNDCRIGLRPVVDLLSDLLCRFVGTLWSVFDGTIPRFYNDVKKILFESNKTSDMILKKNNTPGSPSNFPGVTRGGAFPTLLFEKI